MSKHLFVDVSSIYSTKKGIDGIKSLATSASRLGGLDGVVYVISDVGGVNKEKLESDFSDIGIDVILCEGSMANCMDQLPSDSHIMSDDPFVIAKINEHTLWDNNDLSSYKKTQLDEMFGFNASGMGVYALIRGSEAYGFSPMDGVMQMDAIDACKKVASVRELIDSIDKQKVSSRLNSKQEIVRERIGHLRNMLGKQVTLAWEDKVQKVVNSNPSVQNPNGEEKGSYAKVRQLTDIEHLYNVLSQSNSIAMQKDEKRLYIRSNELNFDIAFSESLPENTFFTMIGDALSGKSITMFESKSLRKSLLLAGCENVSIDDIATATFVHNNLSKNPTLEEVAQRYGNIDLPLGDTNDAIFGKLGELKGIMSSILEKMEEVERKYYKTVELPVLDVVARMETTGIYLNQDKLNRVHQKCSDIASMARNYVSNIVGRECDLSDKDIAKILYDDMKIRLIRGKRSVAADALEKIAKANPQHKSLIKVIMGHKKQMTMMEKYTGVLGKYVNPETSMIHPNIYTTSAKTGRLSARDPNLMAIPKKGKEGAQIKSCFEADKGKVFVKADYSQIELKILAHITQEPALLDGFNNGLDVHTNTAAVVFGKPYEEVTEQERQNSKAINYGLIYGMQAYSLSEKLGVTPDKAEEFINLYFEKLPRVKKYIDDVIEHAENTGYVKTILGRKLYIENIQSENQGLQKSAQRSASNAPMQGSAAEIIKIAMSKLGIAKLEAGLNFNEVLQIHDEIVVVCDASEVEKTKEVLQSVMENAVKLRVPINVDVEAAYNLNDTELKTPSIEEEYQLGVA